MTFKKGEKHASRNTMTLYKKPLEVVPKFNYLGVILQTKQHPSTLMSQRGQQQK